MPAQKRSLETTTPPRSPLSPHEEEKADDSQQGSEDNNQKETDDDCGIIRKTRTVMECLHRFCRECIDKSMRLGNNECPACRTHCASRRSLRDDPNYDALIAALYPDIDKYEEEELAFHEEEKARNKQYVAMQTSMEVGEIEILIVKDFHPVNNPLNFRNQLLILNPCDHELQLLSEHQTLGEIHASFTQQNLVLAYRQKA
ncbi:UNVERIFIED_CONTAM: putative E3 ubiquitin-protein ligase RING1a [Sesamum radiatum]|uniref:E3 ubiquitin-protein ligase RING1a n=1 Tax=Sesamum radiatum TaxID=300843 RepID=A0AAW2T298_SESRA